MQESLKYVAAGIRLLKPELKVPLIGFCGAPFTMASYMIEGKSSRDFRKTKQWTLRDPASFHRLLQRLADYAIDYLEMQIKAGVDAVQIFDSWAGMLAYSQFREFSLPYLDKMVKHVQSKAPVILSAKVPRLICPRSPKSCRALSVSTGTHPSQLHAICYPHP